MVARFDGLFSPWSFFERLRQCLIGKNGLDNERSPFELSIPLVVASTACHHALFRRPEKADYPGNASLLCCGGRAGDSNPNR